VTLRTAGPVGLDRVPAGADEEPIVLQVALPGV
jgi:hypothetical protein